MSDRKRKYKCAGGGFSYDGVWRERKCDGKRHFDTYRNPKRSYDAGPCNCAAFMEAVAKIFGVTL